MLLASALEQGWAAIDLERWIAMGGVQDRVLIVRHDVDQHPATAIKMARIDARHGVSGTWYFRWRTFSRQAIEAVRSLGGGIGFHYETLTRLALARGLRAGQIDDQLIEEARAQLPREIELFESYAGPIRSICAHGDTRVPGVTNQVLVHDVDPSALGGRFDANEALSAHRLGLWMTDRAASDGRWKDGIDPLAVLRDSADPILCLTHPNNWCSGASLWADRAKAALFPRPSPGGARSWLGLRTGADRPPRPAPDPPAASETAREVVGGAGTPSFAPIGTTLRREVARHCYDHGQRLASADEREMLDTSTAGIESFSAALDRLLAGAGARAGGPAVEDLEALALACGFGALALLLAFRGARVTAVEDEAERVALTARVAAEHRLELRFLSAPDVAAQLERYDLATIGPVTQPGRRSLGTLTLAFRALRAGGTLVVPDADRHRSPALHRDLRRAGFAEIRSDSGYVAATRPEPR